MYRFVNGKSAAIIYITFIQNRIYVIHSCKYRRDSETESDQFNDIEIRLNTILTFGKRLSEDSSRLQGLTAEQANKCRNKQK